MLLNLLGKRKPFPINGLLHRFCSASASQITDPKPPNFSIKDYLISSFGFTPDKAARVAKPIAHLKSPHKPDAVRRFLELNGFTAADIKAFVALRSDFLCASVEDTLAPNLRDLTSMGLSCSTFTKIIASDPAILHYRSAMPRIKFWKDFLGGDDKALVKLFQNNKGLVTLDIGKNIEPKISLFKTHGLSMQDIKRILLRIPRIINANPCMLENVLKRTKDLGFQTQSRMFVYGLHSMFSNNTQSLKKKMELLKSFGWSEDQFLSSLQRDPHFVQHSEKNLEAKMNFLIGEASCDTVSIVSHTRLLHCSLDKRLRPRNHVLNLLESKGLSYKGRGFFSAMLLTDKMFVERFILPHKKLMPELHQGYLTACDSGSQSGNLWFYRFCSASASQITDPQTPKFSIKDYLISSFGFTPDKAARVAKPIAHLKSPHKPDAVRRFLDHNGFTASDIKALVGLRSDFLCTSAENTLAPNLRLLSAMGLSDSAFTKILRSHPATLYCRSAVPRIQFWKDFFGGDEKALVKLFQHNKGLANFDIGKNIEPKISLFKSHGLSLQDIRRILLSVPRAIMAKPCLLQTVLKRTKDLGFQTQSQMFVCGLRAIFSNSTESLTTKMELLKTFGWSEAELVTALQKDPTFVRFSEQNLQAKMNFLIGEARCDPSYIASHARLLHCSLSKRLIPRNHVMRLLESKRMSNKNWDILSAFVLTDEKFVERYILPHKEEIPELHEAYLTACASGSQPLLKIESLSGIPRDIGSCHVGLT